VSGEGGDRRHLGDGKAPPHAIDRDRAV
jgi:hypothetical protein